MSDNVNVADTHAPGRYKARPSQNVIFMNYVVWDSVEQRPVAYCAQWLDACLVAERWEAHPPHAGWRTP